MIKIFRCLMEYEACGINMIKQDFILALNEESAKETITKRWKLDVADSVSIEEIPFKPAKIVTYFETNSTSERRLVVHECSKCKYQFTNLRRSDFCPGCGSYFEYEVLEID